MARAARLPPDSDWTAPWNLFNTAGTCGLTQPDRAPADRGSTVSEIHIANAPRILTIISGEESQIRRAGRWSGDAVGVYLDTMPRRFIKMAGFFLPRAEVEHP